MPTIYRKTEKGQIEIETRVNRLVPRLRSALIMVDGKRTDDDLRKLISGDGEEALQTLLEMAYTEVAGVVAAAAPAPAPAPAAPPIPTASPAELRAFDDRRRRAVRHLNDLMGPEAEVVAVRLEKCKNWDECRLALDIAMQVLSRARGASAGAEFARRFIEPPLV